MIDPKIRDRILNGKRQREEESKQSKSIKPHSTASESRVDSISNKPKKKVKSFNDVLGRLAENDAAQQKGNKQQNKEKENRENEAQNESVKDGGAEQAQKPVSASVSVSGSASGEQTKKKKKKKSKSTLINPQSQNVSSS